MRKGLLGLAVLVMGFGLAAQMAAGCGGDIGSEAAQAPVTGVDDAGKVWVFESGEKSSVEFSPSHLRDHMLSGLRVKVSYHREDDRLIIDDITD